MSDPTQTGGEEVLRGAAAPRQVPVRDGRDPSNTPVEELVEDIEPDDETIGRLADLWADPDAAEDQVREAAQRAEQNPTAGDDPAAQ